MTALLSTLTTAVLLLSGTSNAHMQMAMPFPIDSQYNPLSTAKDYSYTSPLDANGDNFPCKGYQNYRPALVTANYTAGQTDPMTFRGSTTNDGGSCQISLSNDNGKTFRVIKSIIGGCPLPKKYDFTIPKYAPQGTNLLAWTWYNAVGNRELYMDCAWVDITSSGGSNKKRGIHERRQSTGSYNYNDFPSFDDLPYIWRANLPGTSQCKTIEGVQNDVVFAHPGPDVEYGQGFSSSSKVTENTGCDSANPPGKAYRDIPVGKAEVMPAAGPNNAAPSSGYSIASSAFYNKNNPPAGSTYAPGGASGSVAVSTSASAPAASSAPAAASSSPQFSSIAVPSSAPPAPASTAAASQPPFPTTGSGNGTGSTGSTGSSGLNGSSGSTGSSGTSGSCTSGFKCLRGGKGFAMCSNGKWIDMGSVSAGTTCSGADGSAKIE